MNPPSGLAMLHGLLAAAGATLLLYAAVTLGIPGVAQVGLGFLVIAAVGGVVLNLKYQWERVLIPRGLMIGHAVLALIGFERSREKHEQWLSERTCPVVRI